MNEEGARRKEKWLDSLLYLKMRVERARERQRD